MRKMMVGLLVMTMAACGSTPPGLLLADDVKREVPSPDAPVVTVVTGMNAFAYDLYGKVAKPNTNTVFSPLSISCAFAMVRAGARGETAAQMDSVLHYPADGLHAAMNAIMQAIVTTDKPADADDKAGPVVSVANGLFAQQGSSIEQDFLRTLAAKYGTGMYTVDFKDTGAAKKTIDAWVSERTDERVKELFDQLSPATQLALANAVYFKGLWRTDFPRAEKGPFNRADGTVVQADLMREDVVGRYGEGTGWQAAELPYTGGKFAMWVMLPNAGVDPGTLLRPGVLGSLTKLPANTGSVTVTMPKWKFETTIDLKQTMPLTAAFGSGADFSGIAPGFFLDQAIHRTNIEVDEQGTIAAAVTGISGLTSGPPQPAAAIKLDRPFAFAIVHTETGIPLFVGTVADPTAGY